MFFPSHQVFVFIALILACVVASAASKAEVTTSRESMGFASFWAVFLLIGISIYGIRTMKYHQTDAAAVGMFNGTVFIMGNTMLIIFAIFVDKGLSEEDKDVSNAMQSFGVFSFFIFVMYVSLLRADGHWLVVAVVRKTQGASASEFQVMVANATAKLTQRQSRAN